MSLICPALHFHAYLGTCISSLNAVKFLIDCVVKKLFYVWGMGEEEKKNIQNNWWYWLMFFTSKY